MLLKSLFLLFGFVSLRAEDSIETPQADEIMTSAENKTSEANERSESVIPRTGDSSDPNTSENNEETLFKNKEAEGTVTEKDVEISKEKLSPEDKKADEIMTSAENKTSEANEISESVIPRSDDSLDTNTTENKKEKLFKNKEAEGIVTEKDVEISGRKFSPEDKKARVEELVQDMVDMISEDIAVASQALTEKGSVLSEKETEEFFQSVAENTMYRIKDNTVALKELVVDNDEVSKLVAERIAAKAAAKGFEKVMNDENDVERGAIDGSVAEITKSAQEFIKFALQSA